MSKMKALMLGLLAALLMTLAACDTATAPDSAPIETEAPQGFWDCPIYLPANANRTENETNITYSSDNMGRPIQAIATNISKRPAKRLEGCSPQVGNLFEGRGAYPDLQGGHLIGAQLGGWGGRANLAPQSKRFNLSNYSIIENAAALCKPSNGISMTVGLTYPDGDGAFPHDEIVPETWYVRFTKGGGGVEEATFQNTNNGGPNASQKVDEITKFLRKNGCTGKRPRN